MNKNYKYAAGSTFFHLFSWVNSIFFLVFLSACGEDNPPAATVTQTRTELPAELQKLSANGGDLRAFVTIDGNVEGRIEMEITIAGQGSATAAATITGLSPGAHAVLFSYEFTDLNGTLILATASGNVDLSSDGEGQLSLGAEDYDLASHDDDNDGVSNLRELLLGLNPRITSAPTNAAVATLSIEAIKIFRFTWEDVSDAIFYRLLENADGSSGFKQIGEKIPPGVQSFSHVVPLYLRTNAQYILQSCNIENCKDSEVITVEGLLIEGIGFFKASKLSFGSMLGSSVHLNADGSVLAVGATDIDTVYVFVREDGLWRQQALISKGMTDSFGYDVMLSDDGKTLAVTAMREDSQSTAINEGQEDNSATDSGAVYVFVRDDGTWIEQAFIKASNAEAGDLFGSSLGLSGDGNTLAVGALFEDSNATGINRNQSDNTALNAGAVYIYRRNAETWQQQAYIKTSNTDASDQFGISLSLSGDGGTLAVGATRDDSSDKGITVLGNMNNDSVDSGAVYVFTFESDAGWRQQSYIKASNSGSADQFGHAVSLSTNGNTLAVSARVESVLPNSDDFLFDDLFSSNRRLYQFTGRVYVFVRNEIWVEQQIFESTDVGDNFGVAISLSGDGSLLAVGASGENSDALGINGDQLDNTFDFQIGSAGAVYVFDRNKDWTLQAFVKANARPGGAAYEFGYSLGLSRDGNSLAVGETHNFSGSTGINNLNSFGNPFSGAAYLY